MPDRATIERFLAGRRLGIVGVSRNQRHFANQVHRDLQAKGYEMFPVHREAAEIDGRPCAPSVAALPDDLDGLIVMVPAESSAAVVAECADRGIPRVWLHRGAGPGSVSDEAVAVARERGLELVDGACPLMFVTPTGWIHRWHRRFAGRRILADAS